VISPTLRSISEYPFVRKAHLLAPCAGDERAPNARSTGWAFFEMGPLTRPYRRILAGKRRRASRRALLFRWLPSVYTEIFGLPDDQNKSINGTAGLCATCIHAETIHSNRGSIF